MQFLTFLTIVLLGAACNSPVKKDTAGDKDHPFMVKKPANGNLSSGLLDRAGNLWFGTNDNGLYKYDGKSFTQYTITDGLNSNNISCLMEDRDEQIWIGTVAGPCKYDGKTIVSVPITLPKDLPPNKNPYYQNHWVYSMLQARDGKYWFVTIDGVYIYDGKSFTHFPINEAKNSYLTSNDKVERMLEDKNGNIWFGSRTNEGVFRYDGKTITHFKLEELFQTGPKPKPHSWGWPQWQDKDGHIWFSNWGGAYRYDGKTFTKFPSPEGSHTEVTRIIEDKNGDLLFGTSDGLRIYDGKTFTDYKEGLANPWIWAVVTDATGNCWVGTRAEGLYLFDGAKFVSYTREGK